MTDINCISINYKLCDKSFRSRFTFSLPQREELLFSVKELSPVLVCTCNRTELYYFGSPADGAELLARFGDVSPEKLRRRIMTFSGKGALKHLFYVCCGIDSMVIGEDEILGQVRGAYTFSKERLALSHESHMIFQAAFAAAKKVKTETALSKTSVSTATLAAKQAAHFADKVNVLLIGASGEIGSKTLKNLLSYKNVAVTATQRSHSGIFELCANAPALTVIPYESRFDSIGKFNCIISATSSPHYTVTADMLEDADGGEKRLLLIDLAVPNDIDPAAAHLKGVTLLDIDHFSKLAAENNALKLGSVEASHDIIAQELDELEKQLAFHDFLPEFRELSPSLKELSAEELFFRLKSNLSCGAFEQVIDVIKTFGAE